MDVVKLTPAPPVIAVSANSSWALSNYRMGLLRALQDRGCDVVALVPVDEGAANLAEAGIKVHNVPIAAHRMSPFGELRLFVRYLRLLRRLRPAVYLGFTIKPNIYGSIAASVWGVPVFNNVTGLGVAFERRGLLQWIVSQLYRRALRKSRRVFFQNHESLELFRKLEFVTEGQAELLPGSGIDLERFSPTAHSGRASEPFTFLLASRLMWQKGIAEYCAAASWFRDNQPGPRFQLLGAIEPMTNRSGIPLDLIQQWQEECDVEYLGSTDDVRPFIEGADCIVLPSYYPEGVPRVLIEAAAMGKPIITTDTPGCRDSVDAGETGFLCEQKSSDSLVEAMRWLLELSEDERVEMGRRAREKAERDFDERLVIAAYQKVLDEILAC